MYTILYFFVSILHTSVGMFQWSFASPPPSNVFPLFCTQLLPTLSLNECTSFCKDYSYMQTCFLATYCSASTTFWEEEG